MQENRGKESEQGGARQARSYTHLTPPIVFKKTKQNENTEAEDTKRLSSAPRRLRLSTARFTALKHFKEASKARRSRRKIYDFYEIIILIMHI